MVGDAALDVCRCSWSQRAAGLGLLNLSVRADQPMDDGSCTLLGSLCAASAEIHNDIYIDQRGSPPEMVAVATSNKLTASVG